MKRLAVIVATLCIVGFMSSDVQADHGHRGHGHRGHGHHHRHSSWGISINNFGGYGGYGGYYARPGWGFHYNNFPVYHRPVYGGFYGPPVYGSGFGFSYSRGYGCGW